MLLEKWDIVNVKEMTSVFGDTKIIPGPKILDIPLSE